MRQSTLAEVQIAVGVATCQAREWHPGWVAAQDVLRNALTDNVGADTLQAKLESYIDERRAMTAHLPFVKFVRQLESLFAREQSLMGFHFADDENAYRQREARLGERLSAPGTSADERISVAREILNERARYQSIYLPRLDAVGVDVTKAFGRCEALLTFFSERTRPEVHRWHALTAAQRRRNGAAVTVGDGSSGPRASPLSSRSRASLARSTPRRVSRRSCTSTAGATIESQTDDIGTAGRAPTDRR